MAPQFLLNFLLLLLMGQQNMGYKMPHVNIEIFNERGLKISIPDEVRMQRVFVILQVDGSCPVFMDCLTQATNGSWTSVQRIRLQNDDKLRVSLLVQYNNNIYEKSETHVILNTRFLTTQQSNTVNIWRSKAPETLDNNNENKCQLYLPSDQKLFKHCKPTNSITSRNSGSQVTCQGDLIFEDDFSEGQLNSSVWMHDIRQRMYYVEEELVAFDNSPRISYVREGHLHIVPMVASEVTEGIYKLGDRCTAVDNRQLECSISKGSFFKIKPPVYSAQLHTRESFSFKYGKVVVRAKLPKGDWLFPYMMLQPVSTYAETHFANQLRK
ncbi:PREDICTED: gram-negative bacteria-binding protein 2 isoform X1 [Drosophila arizonae]|uniref:Gram-negative bacteria-binding protein 2 isoform X1 n=1 Tax=Drosophila arizonae TaxID=7263 RepID=A0ABM1P8Z4_DROAR|nr:PREDICTED: gram-negative bacteria-binding protein 2 isoform X1 [Drosophila arizonae]